MTIPSLRELGAEARKRKRCCADAYHSEFTRHQEYVYKLEDPTQLLSRGLDNDDWTQDLDNGVHRGIDWTRDLAVQYSWVHQPGNMESALRTLALVMVGEDRRDFDDLLLRIRDTYMAEFRETCNEVKSRYSPYTRPKKGTEVNWDGKHGTIVRWDAREAKYLVMLDGSEQYVKGECLCDVNGDPVDRNLTTRLAKIESMIYDNTQIRCNDLLSRSMGFRP